MVDDALGWDLIESEALQDCRVFNVRRDRARSRETQRTENFFTLDASDWVNVVAVTASGNIVMVRQYRHGSRSTTLEIPGGMIDEGERPAQAAAREMLEETGYEAASLEHLGVVNPNPALFGNRCHTFLARDVWAAAPVRNEGSESTVVELVPRGQIGQRMLSGEIDHALVIAAFHWCTLVGLRL